jgi:hypothetical protein
MSSFLEIMRMDIPPVQVLVPGFYTEGLTFLIGSPKIGKSRTILTTCLQCVLGWPLLEWEAFRPVRPFKVLYLALEDENSSIKDRGLQIVQESGINVGGAEALLLDNFHIEYKCNELGDRTIGWLRERFMKEGFDIIVIDTLAKIYPDLGYGGNASIREAKMITPLFNLAKDLKKCIVVIHHDSKGRYDDPVQAVNGTTGLAGTVDNFIFMSRQNRWNPVGKLMTTGRKMRQDGEYKLDFGGADRFMPRILGTFQEGLRSGSIGDQALEWIKVSGSGKTGLMAKDLGVKPDSLRRTLKRMQEKGLVEETDGVWRLTEGEE